LEIAEGKTLTIEDTDVHFSGEKVTSVIEFKGDTGGVYLFKSLYLGKGKYLWISSSGSWLKTS
jgi:hypothetical protein